MELATVKELKAQILTKISEEELNNKYAELIRISKMYEVNKRAGYLVIASKLNINTGLKFKTEYSGSYPVKIKDLKESEKINFDLVGYLVDDLTPRIKNGNMFMFMTLADNTGIQTVKVWADQIESVLEKDLKFGDFVKITNLYWPDKTQYQPSYGKYSNIIKITSPEFEFNDIVVNNTSSVVENGYFAIKGVVTFLPKESKQYVYHCEEGHRFKNLNDADVGTLSLCAKCEKPMEVHKHIDITNMAIADEYGILQTSVGIFANLDDLNVMDEAFFRGKYENNIFKCNYVKILKKNN